MEVVQIEAVLVVAEELHFGRASQRLHVSQPMISRRIADLEREIGGQLFERSSRRVRLTPLGATLLEDLKPGYTQITGALCRARDSARQPEGSVTVGFTTTTEGPVISRLVEAHRRTHPGSQVRLQQVPTGDPYTGLRAGRIDVLINWLAGGEADLTFGPELERQERVLAVANRHPLARRRSVSVEDLAGLPVFDTPPAFPTSLWHAIVPPETPSGRPIPRTTIVINDLPEVWPQVALGQIVHPTMASVAPIARDDIVLVPIIDMPPLPLGLIWCSAHENARIRALAQTARSVSISDGKPLSTSRVREHRSPRASSRP